MRLAHLARRSIPLAVLPLASCIFVVEEGDWDGYHSFRSHAVRGSGVRADEARQVDPFHAVQLESWALVRVTVGGDQSVQLSGDDNLLSKVQTTVENGVLTIDLHDSCSFQCGLEITLATPALDRFTIAGSGDVEIEGLAAEELELAIDGSGTIRAQGNARSLTASIEGSGDLNLVELEAQTATLSIEGSGTMNVNVTGELQYTIEGSGDIRYTGQPDLHGRVDGSGNIERRR